MKTLIRFTDTVTLGFDARDMWIGLYVDPDAGKLYFCALPCIVLVLGPYASLSSPMGVKRWTAGAEHGPIEVVPAAAYYEAVARIRKAPHARDCEAGQPWPGPCTCWKRDWPEDAA